MTTNSLGLRGQAAAEENGTGPACEAGPSAGNDEEAACEAASPVEQSALQQEIGTALMNDETTRTTTSTSPAISGAEEAVNRILVTSRGKAIAALPKVVDEAMRKTVSGYTPELAAQVADFVAAELRQSADSPLTPPQCPDGIAWCDGNPLNHTDTDDHRHEGPEHTLNGSYLCDPTSDGIATFQLAQWPDGQPHVVFQGSGMWADIDLTQVDELIGDAVPWLVQLIATRRHLAILLNPGSTPFAQADDQQTASAAFCVATDAMRIALDKSPDPAGLLQAMRTYLDMAETEATA